MATQTYHGIWVSEKNPNSHKLTFRDIPFTGLTEVILETVRDGVSFEELRFKSIIHYKDTNNRHLWFMSQSEFFAVVVDENALCFGKKGLPDKWDIVFTRSA